MTRISNCPSKAHHIPESQFILSPALCANSRTADPNWKVKPDGILSPDNERIPRIRHSLVEEHPQAGISQIHSFAFSQCAQMTGVKKRCNGRAAQQPGDEQVINPWKFDSSVHLEIEREQTNQISMGQR